ncbi:MAG TPA: ATP-binding cassette domain-containing protein, partial [Longimicrobiales bacterium]|nr:ATP-binding cassette domain-containing protein [Longimicrobiales bacterium]
MSPAKLSAEGLTVSYGSEVVLRGIDLEVREHEIFGIIGPAGSGKTSFLRSLNRMDELDSAMTVQGNVRFNGRDVREIRNV